MQVRFGAAAAGAACCIEQQPGSLTEGSPPAMQHRNGRAYRDRQIVQERLGIALDDIACPGQPGERGHVVDSEGPGTDDPLAGRKAHQQAGKPQRQAKGSGSAHRAGPEPVDNTALDKKGDKQHAKRRQIDQRDRQLILAPPSPESGRTQRHETEQDGKHGGSV